MHSKHSLRSRLRPATNLDGPAVQALVFKVLAEYSLACDPEGIDADLNDLEAYARNGGSFQVMVDETGQVIGSIGLKGLSKSTCELRKMYLAKSARGQGLGRFLLEEALEEAERLGFSRVVLDTASVLREAIRLYEGYGFQEYHPDHLPGRCDKAYQLHLKGRGRPRPQKPGSRDGGRESPLAED